MPLVAWALRNFRLAEEHWNLVWQNWATICIQLRNFRLAEEHWNCAISLGVSLHKCDWGIFGSLKSTETSNIFQHALKKIQLRNFRLAEEHWNTTVPSGTCDKSGDWGIFGSLKSTETGTSKTCQIQHCALRNFRLAEEHWNITYKKNVLSYSTIEEFSARWRALKPWLFYTTNCQFFHWGIFGSLKSTETAYSQAPACMSPTLRNFRLAEEHWNLTITPKKKSTALLRNFRLAEEHWNLSLIRCLLP